jgi:antitoxin VapB
LAALNIKDEETHRLARRLVAATGESLTTAVRTAIAERLARVERSRGVADAELVERLDAIARHCGQLPILSQRSEDEILGYDERGLPGRW